MLEASEPFTDFHPCPPPFLEGSALSPPSLGGGYLFKPGRELGRNRDRSGDTQYTYAIWQFSKSNKFNHYK